MHERRTSDANVAIAVGEVIEARKERLLRAHAP
jgi:hypothetical protein